MEVTEVRHQGWYLVGGGEKKEEMEVGTADQ